MQPETVSLSETISDFLRRDHHRLDALLVEVRRLVGAGELARAERVYQDFHQGLTRHIQLEEELLFPLFEQPQGIIDGPIAVMHEEHRMIQKALTIILAALAVGNVSRCNDGMALLGRVLPPHHFKEERILYPEGELLMTPARRRALLARLSAR